MYPNVYYSFDVIYKKCILNDISWRQIKIIYMIRNAVCLETLIMSFITFGWVVTTVSSSTARLLMTNSGALSMWFVWL